MTIPATPGSIPQSDALAEALPGSLAELMSRDPEGFSRLDRDKIVEALRAQRAKLAVEPASRPAKVTSKAARRLAPGETVNIKIGGDLDDLLG
jgi:hypothetical protein